MTRPSLPTPTRLAQIISATVFAAQCTLTPAIAADQANNDVAGITTATAKDNSNTVTSDTAAKQQRPRIGLVLSGGGARGYAHIGVLQYLEKMHIPVDYIAGTSMGALVGGLYASGISASDLEYRLSQINLTDIAFDRNERANLPQSQREDDFQYPIAIAAGYGDGKIKLAPGLLQGNNLLTLLQNWTAKLPADITFDRLPIPFHAVATDLSNGTEVILDHGSLPAAMRASMAVPGLFAPFQIKGKTLVDGGLVSNLPIQQARTMGADIIIAVNIATPLQDPATLQSPTAVAQQMVGILLQQNVKAQKALLHKDDILIEPVMTGVSLTDFAAAKDGISVGRDAAQQLHARLAPLALTTSQWQDHLAQRSTELMLAKDTRIDAVEINTNGRIPASYVRSRVSVTEGSIYDSEQINHELTQLSINGDFKQIRQELVREDGKNIVRIDAEEKTWGPQYLLFGLGLSNNFNGKGSVNLQIGHRYPWMNQSGLEWRNDLVLGDKQASLHSELRQPIWDALGVYISPYVELNRRYVDVYPDASDTKAQAMTQYRIDVATAGVDLGMPLGRLGELRMGVNYQYSRYTPTYNLVDPEGALYDASQSKQPVLRAQLTIDQLDDTLFPRKGYYLYADAHRGLGKENERYSDARVKTLFAFSRGRNTVNLAVEAASYLSDNTAGLGFSLGGFQRLSAYAPDQFFGNYLLYGRMTYLHDLADNSLIGLRNPVIGSSVEVGNVWQTREAFGSGPYKKSVSLFLGGRSPVGPLYFGAALGQKGVWNVYVQLGRVF